MASWVQHPITGKLIPRAEYVRPDMKAGAFVQGDITGFVSPIDGSLIDDRGKLRRHNERHGVTDARDYSASYYRTKEVERAQALSMTTERHKTDRREALNCAYERLRKN